MQAERSPFTPKHCHFFVTGKPLAELVSQSMRVASRIDNNSPRSPRYPVAYSPLSAYDQVHTPESRKLIVKLIISIHFYSAHSCINFILNSVWPMYLGVVCIVNYPDDA